MADVTFGEIEALIGYRRGAQDCREMMARFVEQGGDAVTANSIRLNWNPDWGNDPGKPESDVGIASAVDNPHEAG